MKTGLVDKPECREHYVAQEYTGTVGCSTSPTLYGHALNISDGKEKCVCRQTLYNIGDVDHRHTCLLSGRGEQQTWPAPPMSDGLSDGRKPIWKEVSACD